MTAIYFTSKEKCWSLCKWMV